MKYLIRSCEPNDVDALVSLCRKHAAYERAEYTSEGKADKLRDILFKKDSPLYCLVVEVDHEVVGYASYTFDYSTWDAAYFLHLDCLYLEDEYRGFGIGEEMMRILSGVAKENTCINIQWQTPVFNEKAIRFYKRIGGIAKEKQRFFLTPD